MKLSWNANLSISAKNWQTVFILVHNLGVKLEPLYLKSKNWQTVSILVHNLGVNLEPLYLKCKSKESFII